MSTKKVEEKKDVVVAKKVLPPALLSSLAEDAVKAGGFDGLRPEDYAIPFLSILQALSPQLRPGQEIEGAKQGYFYNSVTGEVYAPPIKLISCAFKHVWVEWGVRESGGGYVAQHEGAAGEAIMATTKKDSKNRDILPNGNHLQDTAYHFVMGILESGRIFRAVASFTSTQLKKSRKWNSQARDQQMLINGKLTRLPRYSLTYTVKTVLESNDVGSWMGWDISDPQVIADAALYAEAKLFYEEVRSGTVKVAPPVVDGEAAVPPAQSEVM